VEGNNLISAEARSKKRMARAESGGKKRSLAAKTGRKSHSQKRKPPDLSGPAVQDFPESNALLGLEENRAAPAEDASIEAPLPDLPNDACVDSAPQHNEPVNI